jgi:hypothetical protein
VDEPHEPPVEVKKRSTGITAAHEAVGDEDLLVLEQDAAESDNRRAIGTITAEMTKFEHPIANLNFQRGVKRRVRIRTWLEEA